MKLQVEIKRLYVIVNADVSLEGKITPKVIKLLDGRVFPIDRIIDVRKAASTTAGGIGLRYTCLVNDQEKFLYYENPAWFVEGRFRRKKAY